MTRAKRIKELQTEVKQMVDAEALYLYRLARKAVEHQCSDELVGELEREAEALRTSLTAAPELCLKCDLQKHFKHAFRSA